MDKYIDNMAQYVGANPESVRGTRFLEYMKCNGRRQRTRARFYAMLGQAHAGELAGSRWAAETFGIDIGRPTDVPLPGSEHCGIIAPNQIKGKERMNQMLGLLGVSGGIEALLGPFRPRSEFEDQLADRSWVSPAMSALTKESAFPGAAVMAEYQVNGHVAYSVNEEFSHKFFTAAELILPGAPPHHPWGSRKIIDIGDLSEYIGQSMREGLAFKPDPTEPSMFSGILALLDKKSVKTMSYVRRYFWIEQGGDRCATVYIIYPLPTNCKHLASAVPKHPIKPVVKPRSKLKKEPKSKPVQKEEHSTVEFEKVFDSADLLKADININETETENMDPDGTDDVLDELISSLMEDNAQDAYELLGMLG